MLNVRWPCFVPDDDDHERVIKEVPIASPLSRGYCISPLEATTFAILFSTTTEQRQTIRAASFETRDAVLLRSRANRHLRSTPYKAPAPHGPKSASKQSRSHAHRQGPGDRYMPTLARANLIVASQNLPASQFVPSNTAYVCF
jgi:hypothetical protein